MTTAISNKVPSQDLLDSVNGKKDVAKSTAIEAQDRFMKLLVTQMKNQDPLNPLDNAQVTSQLAQLSTVAGIDKTNLTLESLNASFQASQNLQATTMIGHGVMVDGNALTLADGKALLGAEMLEPADKVIVNIMDPAGRVVNAIDLGAQAAGMVPIVWDGKTSTGADARPGAYTFSVIATRGAAPAKASPMAVAEVTSVSTSSNGIKLNLQGQPSVSMDKVRQII